MSIQLLAKTANGYLVRDRERDLVLPADGAPAWFTNLCRHAHANMMPDDWRYEFIQDALDALEDCDEPDNCEPDVDSLYPYTSDRLNWLASHLNRAGYCDEAMEELGSEFTSTTDLIALGMYWELREVFQLVREFLQERAEMTQEEQQAEAE